MTSLWTSEHETLLEDLKANVLARPTLARPDNSCHYYLKTYWSKDKMGAVLVQADDSPESREAEAEERAGGKCAFDLLHSFCAI